MSFISQHLWFFGFWGFFFLLRFIETRVSPRLESKTKRTRWPANIGLGVTNGALASLLPVGTVLAASWAAVNGIGFFNLFEPPIGLTIVATVLLRTFGQYFFHRLVHKMPLLWSVHHVHHCDSHLDSSTGLRFHPLEMLANIAFMTPLVIVAGLDPVTLAVFEIFEIIIGIATHTSIVLPNTAEEYLRPIFITPGLHRLHHSDFAPETENNFGATFSFWDRIFGTYLAEPIREPPEFEVGIQGIGTREAADLGWLLLSPRDVLRTQMKRQRRSI